MKKYILFLFFFFLASSGFSSEGDKPCYLMLEVPKGQKTNVLRSLSTSLLNRFYAKIEPLPSGGISSKACTYTVTLAQDANSSLITFSGKDVNSFGESKLKGLDGMQQAILRAIARAKIEKKPEICEVYRSLLPNECKGVSLMVKNEKTSEEDPEDNKKSSSEEDENEYTKWHNELEERIDSLQSSLDDLEKGMIAEEEGLDDDEMDEVGDLLDSIMDKGEELANDLESAVETVEELSEKLENANTEKKQDALEDDYDDLEKTVESLEEMFEELESEVEKFDEKLD